MAPNPRRRRRRAEDESSALEGTPAPDPLKESSAEVEQAQLAEAGAQRGESGDAEAEHVQLEKVEPVGGLETVGEDEAGEISEEELAAQAEAADPRRRRSREEEDEQAVALAHDAKIARQAEAAAAGAKRRGGVVVFLRHCVEELRRVQWPDRRQVGQATAVTLGFVVVAGGFLGLMDAVWQPLIEAILGTGS